MSSDSSARGKATTPASMPLAVTSSSRWAAFACLVAFWAAFMAPVLMSGGRWGIWDWDQHLAFYEFERISLLEYGVLPLWAPYLSGGGVSLQHPLSSFLWPDVLWVLAFGVPYGVKLLLAFRFAIGLAGAWALARDFGLGITASVLSACVMTGSGAWSAHVAFGHFEWSLFAYVPWALLASRRAAIAGSPFWIAIATACTAALYLGGGIYLLVGFAFLLVFFSIFEALSRRRWQALAWPLLALALSAPLSAAKLLPNASYFGEYPRDRPQRRLLLQFEPERGWLEIPRVLQFIFLERGFDYGLDFTVPPSHVGHPGTPAAYRERWNLFQDLNHNAYVGALVVFLALVGSAAPGRDRAVLVLTLFALLFLALSDSIQRVFGFHPWWAVKKLPGLVSLGVSGRFIILAVVPLALLSGAGLQALVSRVALPRALRVLGVLVVVFVGTDLARNAWPLLSASFPHPPIATREEPFVTFDEPRAGFDLATVRSRVGARRASSNLVSLNERAVIPKSDAAYRGEAWRKSGGSARLVEMQPNAAVIEIEDSKFDVLVLNQRYVTGWHRSDRDACVLDVDGLVATEIWPQDDYVRLEFRPPRLYAGIAVSAVSLVGLLAMLASRSHWWERIRERSRLKTLLPS